MGKWEANTDRQQRAIEDAFELAEGSVDLGGDECVRPVFIVGSIPSGGSPVARTAILSGETESGVIDMTGFRLAAIVMPSGWTAADLTFKAAPSPDGPFLDLYDDAGSQATLTVDSDRIIGIDDAAGALAAVQYFKLVASVAQGADREIVLMFKS